MEYYINNYPNYEPSFHLSREDFSQIHIIMIKFHSSVDFLYMSQEIQKIVKDFLKFVENNLEHYDYYKYEDETFYDAVEILSGIFPILKREIGLRMYIEV